MSIFAIFDFMFLKDLPFSIARRMTSLDQATTTEETDSNTDYSEEEGSPAPQSLTRGGKAYVCQQTHLNCSLELHPDQRVE